MSEIPLEGPRTTAIRKFPVFLNYSIFLKYGMLATPKWLGATRTGVVKYNKKDNN